MLWIDGSNFASSYFCIYLKFLPARFSVYLYWYASIVKRNFLIFYLLTKKARSQAFVREVVAWSSTSMMLMAISRRWFTQMAVQFPTLTINWIAWLPWQISRDKRPSIAIIKQGIWRRLFEEIWQVQTSQIKLETFSKKFSKNVIYTWHIALERI